MTRRTASVFLALVAALLAILLVVLSTGNNGLEIAPTLGALFAFDETDFSHYAVIYQRLPRSLIAIYVGGVMAASGLLLQTLFRNPLASPSTLGINAGATLFVVFGAFYLDFDFTRQGGMALLGAVTGFAVSLAISRMVSGPQTSQSLSMILSGTLITMLFLGFTNAILLSNPSKRADYLGWVTGNINQVYADRLYLFWPLGLLCILLLFVMARGLTLLSLGEEKAASAGVNVKWVRRLSLTAALAGAGSAVAICGPISFVGLAVPHIIRPLVGARFSAALPACILLGSVVCLCADLAARTAFAPYILHTGVLLDLIGGIVFLVIVKRYYLSKQGQHAR